MQVSPQASPSQKAPAPRKWTPLASALRLLARCLALLWTTRGDRSSAQRMFMLMLRYSIPFSVAIICMVGYNIFNALPTWYAKDVVDSIQPGKVPALERFGLVGLAIVVIFFCKGLFYFGHNYLLGWVGQKMILELRARLHAHLQSFSYPYFVRTRPGTLVSHFTTDLLTLQNALRLSLIGPLRDIPMILIFLIILFTRSWELFLFSVAVIPVAFVLIHYFGQKIKTATVNLLASIENINNLISENIQGIRVVKAFGMEAYEAARFERVNENAFRQGLHTVQVSSYSPAILETIGAIAGGGIILGGGYLIIYDMLTPGEFVSFLLAFFMLNTPVKRLNGFNQQIQEGLAAAKRVFSLLDTHAEEIDPPHARSMPPIQREIRICVPEFRYQEDNPPALREIDLSVRAGEVLALVGPSGAGKTTLVNLLPRFLDVQSGAILIDGVDIRDYTYTSLREQIAIVSQEVFLFDDTIAHNIAYGDLTRSQEVIVAAAKAAQADEFICTLPQGYDTVIGQGGLKLSGGQRQRLVIARAVIKNAPILILDEATSALDTESEQEVQKAIHTLISNRTTFVIAHRLSTVRRADRICVMDNGQIVEMGSHEELISKGGVYQRLHEKQFQDFSPKRKLWQRIPSLSRTREGKIRKDKPRKNGSLQRNRA